MIDAAYLSRFSPRRTRPEVREAIFVQADAIVDDAVARLRESVLTQAKHHLLLVGPRGAGKSHLVATIADRLRGDHDLAQRLRIAWIDEGETPASFLKLLLRIRHQLTSDYPDDLATSAADARLEDLVGDPATAARLLTKDLAAALASRCVLLVVENLDQLMRNLGDSGQKELRAFLQEQPRFAILATARDLIDDLAKRRAPFFGFFQSEHLPPLTLASTGALWSSIAAIRGEKGLLSFLATPSGQARVRALHHLAAGNPRICVVLAGYLTADSLDQLITPVRQTLDELQPYFLEPLRGLPPQQREIVEFLCGCTRPVPVKQIQTALLGSHSTAASELKKLRGKGLVRNQRRGRESLYEVRDPWLRLCWQQHNRGDATLRQLVGLLRAWYAEPGDHRRYTARLDEVRRTTADPVRWQRDLLELVRDCRAADSTPRLGAALLDDLTTLAVRSPLAEVRRAWAATWEQVAKSHPEVALAARLLHAGVTMLDSGDESALLDLVEEERRMLADHRESADQRRE